MKCTFYQRYGGDDMVKLSEIYRLIGNYIELHGDKDVISIATHCGHPEHVYTFNLCDIHYGSIGTNPYTGKDKLNICKSSFVNKQ